jgi:hypothetical protein
MAKPEAIPAADFAAGSVVHVQTWARVSVVVHAFNFYKVDLEPFADPLLTGTGFFVNPGGVVVTAADVVKVDRARLETWAINQAFIRTFKLPPPGDPFSRTHSPDPETEGHLQGCYDYQKPDSECAVFVSTETRVYPYVTPPLGDGLLATPIASSGPIAVLSSTATGDVTTAALATAPSNHWTYVAFPDRPHGAPPATMSGDFAGGAVPADMLAQLAQLGGSGLRGSVLVDDRGAVLQMLESVNGKPVAVPAADIATILNKVGTEARTGPVDTQLTTGLDYVASHEYANAEPYLDQAARATKGQAVALKYLDLARSRKDGADDMSNMADSHTGMPDSSGLGWVLPTTLTVIAVLALAAGVVLWMRRRRSTPAPPEGPAGPMPQGPPPSPTPVRPEPAPRRSDAGPTAVLASPTSATVVAPNGHEARAADESRTTVHARPDFASAQVDFCSACGVRLAPGDRFCFSCGNAVRRPVGR